MTLTNQEVVELYEGLYSLREDALRILPIKVGFTLVKDIKIIEPVYLAVKNMMKTIGLNYGVSQPDGSIYISEERRPQAQEELEELSNIENTIALDIIPLSAFGDTSLALDDIYKIYPIIDGEA